MSRRFRKELNVIKDENKTLRFCFGTVVLVAVCFFLVIFCTFIQLKLSYPIVHFDAIFDGAASKSLFEKNYPYIPQIPVLMFIAVLLGRKYGTLAVFLYVLAGLTALPIFALGGGISYIAQYNFGYIFAYIPAVFFAANKFSKGWTFKNLVLATIICIAIVHIIGAMYATIIAIIKKDPFSYVVDFMKIQSGVKILYDFIIAFIAALMARVAKKFLWLIMG